MLYAKRTDKPVLVRNVDDGLLGILLLDRPFVPFGCFCFCMENLKCYDNVHAFFPFSCFSAIGCRINLHTVICMMHTSSGYLFGSLVSLFILRSRFFKSNSTSSSACQINFSLMVHETKSLFRCFTKNVLLIHIFLWS